MLSRRIRGTRDHGGAILLLRMLPVWYWDMFLLEQQESRLQGLLSRKACRVDKGQPNFCNESSIPGTDEAAINLRQSGDIGSTRRDNCV